MKQFSEGTVRKRKNASGPWQWQAVITVTDEDGKQTVRTKMTGVSCAPKDEEEKGTRGKPTGKGAVKALEALNEWRKSLIAAEWQAQADALARADAEEAAKDPSNEPLSDYIRRFIDQREAAGIIERSTATSYRASNKHIRDRLAGETLASLTPAKVRDMEAGMTEDGYGPSMVGKVHRLLRQVANQAVNDDVIAKDPTRGVKPPKRKTPKPNAYTATSAAELLAKLDALPTETRATMAARLALMTGMRRGEVCGLKWKDVTLDLDASGKPKGGTIWVNRAIGVSDGGTYEKQAKTDRSRDIPVSRTLASHLAAWRASQALDVVALGGEFPGEQFVIGYADGRFCNPDVVSREWRVLAGQFDIKGTEGRVASFHDLRNTDLSKIPTFA